MLPNFLGLVNSGSGKNFGLCWGHCSWCQKGITGRLRDLSDWSSIFKWILFQTSFFITDVIITLFSVCVCVCVCVLSCFQHFETPQTVACQAPLLMGFPRQKYWSGCHFFLQGIFLTQGSNLCLPHLQANALPWTDQGALAKREHIVNCIFVIFTCQVFCTRFNQS